MPRLAFPVRTDSSCPVRLVADQRRGDSVCDLTEQQQQPGLGVPETEHRLVVEQQVGEPHGGAQVVQHVPHRVGEAPERGQGARALRHPRQVPRETSETGKSGKGQFA